MQSFFFFSWKAFHAVLQLIMGQLFRSPISYFSALMAKPPEVHKKWCQVQLKKSKQKFEFYIILVNGTNMQILMHPLRIQSQQQKKLFKIVTTLKHW